MTMTVDEDLKEEDENQKFLSMLHRHVFEIKGPGLPDIPRTDILTRIESIQRQLNEYALMICPL